MKQLRQAFLLFVLVCLSTSLSAGALEMVESAIESSKTKYYETAFPGPLFQKLSSATVYEGSLAIQLHDGTIAVEVTALFAQEGDAIISFKSAEEYLTSDCFIESLHPSFLLQSDEDAELFQSFLYLVDGNYFSEGYYNEGTTWFFIRDEFFGDIEAWVVETDTMGHITSITYSDDLEGELPDLRGSMTPLHDVDAYEQPAIPETAIEHMERILEEELSYTVEAVLVESPVLSTIWDGTWYRAGITTEECDPDGYQYTSTLTVHGLQTSEGMFLFGSIEAALGDPVVMEALQPTFRLSDDNQAALFSQALDVLLNDGATEAYHVKQGTIWLFIRDEWFGEGMGFIAKLDEQGSVLSLEYSYSIPLKEAIVEEEPPFDASTVDWTLNRVEPEETYFTIMQGEGIPVTLEFDAYAANRAGAWMLTELNNEFYGMSYDSAGLTSPYYDWISTEGIPVGDHTISYLLMEPGTDREHPLSSTAFSVTVHPFDASEVAWDMKLAAPTSSSIDSKQGESIPLIVTFNDTATAQYGVNLVLRHQGEIVGGESSKYLTSPFETMIPGSILTPGFHLVDVLLLPPGGTENAPLAVKSITIRVF
ncbi:MAG: hypothetical protein AB7D92_04980 [Sphaerochaeta sp.]